MAHIADFMVDSSSTIGLNNYIARELSPHSPHDAPTGTSPPAEKEKYVWRMHQPTEPRKYQLFPTLEKLSMSTGRRSPDAESEPAVLKSTIVAERERSGPGNLLRKTKEATLIRRRKISVPELGPMTTVQEVSMDSPTIPGRPPLHERSTSAPGSTWRQNPLSGESRLRSMSGPVLDELVELAMMTEDTMATTIPTPARNTSPNASANSNIVEKSRPDSPTKLPLSPKSLTPLVIPMAQARIVHHSMGSRLKNEMTPPEVPPKEAKPNASPYPRPSPFTPMSSTSTLVQTPVPTPHSAPEGRSSPRPWIPSTSQSPSRLGSSRGPADIPPPQRTTPVPGANLQGHSRVQSDIATAEAFPMHKAKLGHRRGESEGSTSVMDRGRPKKRPDMVTISPVKRPVHKQTPSADEQKAFASLPVGVRATQVSTVLSPSEVDTLRKQALGQASRFEVLSSKDVEVLSRELRGLDERCDYLRKTHRSLRSGRRNLHDRICSYLRSPRVARFSHDSILKQEEALSELDCSIDDWVAKLEQAENRRTRIRQKLLEHVAAALITQPSATNSQANASLVRALSGENTPPRSPTKREAISPQREMERVEEEVERVVEEVRVSTPETVSRGGRDVESIRIYADSDVYALLADVEQEITRMGELSEIDIGDKREKDQLQKRSEKDKEFEKKKEDAISASITLSAVTFEALPARTYTPPARSYTPPITQGVPKHI